MPSHITSHWDYVREGEWSILETYVIAGTAERNVYASLRDHRSISAVPPGQTFHRLRNEVPLPSIGLGTGGIAPELTQNTMLEALSVGYRMFDMAREYGNEHVMGEILASHHEMEHIPHRSELCDPTVEWMHCQDVVDQTGLWIESYMAITRAYAEGRVAAIGVSNFNIELLRELEAAASVVPHVVENFAEPGNVDLDVRLWCSDHATVYIPYASQRNIGDLPIDIRRAIRAASAKHGVSQHAVITRFFLQTGAAVIPRSSNPTHLGENIKLAQFSLDDAEMHSLGWPFAGHGRDEL
ncbi:unnamed protein product [Symbiodinium microadriaticum]|nr:unnamed protein product [Symbiodinium microadriaticum]